MQDFLTAVFGNDPLLFFGILSGVLSLFAYVPYIRDTWRGDTKPQRASWLIWSMLGSLSLASQVVEGATHSLWFAAVQVGGTIAVFTLSIWRGTGQFLNGIDYAVLGAAAFGMLLWHLTSSPAYALGISIAISLLGGSVTVLKAYRDPGSETILTWVVSWIASACAVLSVAAWDLMLLAYPMYLLTLYTGIVTAMVLGHSVPVRGQLQAQR